MCLHTNRIEYKTQEKDNILKNQTYLLLKVKCSNLTKQERRGPYQVRMRGNRGKAKRSASQNGIRDGGRMEEQTDGEMTKKRDRWEEKAVVCLSIAFQMRIRGVVESER